MGSDNQSNGNATQGFLSKLNKKIIFQIVLLFAPFFIIGGIIFASFELIGPVVIAVAFGLVIMLIIAAELKIKFYN